jgi:hypothetical protein
MLLTGIPLSVVASSSLKELGVAPDRLYTDRGLTGTTRVRPGLDQTLAAVRSDDTLVAPN